MKRCRMCHIEKPASQFFANKRNTDGLGSYCKECEKPKRRADYHKHKERRQAVSREWKRRNPERCLAQESKRRHKSRRPDAEIERRRMREKYRIRVGWWKKSLEYFGNSCCYCGEKCESLEMEHMLPLSKGGDDTPENVVPACKSCNRRKNARTLIQWLFVSQANEDIPNRISKTRS